MDSHSTPPHTANGQAHAATSAPLDLPRPKGRNLRWVIIGIIALLTITNYLDRGNLSVAAPQIMQDLHISNAMMWLVLSAFVWPYAIMNLPTGWAVDRFGVKLLLALAAGLWSVVAILTGFARSVGAFIGLRIALGVSEAPLFPAALKATDKWFPEREKAAATSAYIAATQVGLALASPVSTLLMEYFGWPAMFIIMGIFGFVALLGWLVVYREPEQHPRLHSDELRYITAGQQHRQEAPATQQGAHFADSIACGGFPVDIHSSLQPGLSHTDAVGRGFEIAYRSLLPLTPNNLLVAGRCLSSDHAANGSLRITATCFATGEAAGVAAALVVQQACLPAQLPAAALRARLVQRGAIISLDSACA